MTWSYSRLSAFEQCKYSWYLKYIVDDDDTYLAEGNYWAEVGTFMHEILEKIFKEELAPDDAVNYFIDHYDENVLYKASQSIMDRAFEACIDYLGSLDLQWMDHCDILSVEDEQTFDIEGYPFKGYIDLLVYDRSAKCIYVIDHKSAAYPLSEKTGRVLKNSEKSFLSYKKQMYLYCHAVKEKYGRFPDKIIWNHFKAGKFVEIPFVQDEYDEAVGWFLNTIHSIEKEVEFEGTVDYFYCHNLCDFRNSCEYKIYTDEARKK